MTAERVGTLTLKQDVGSYEPRYKKVKLVFWSDGSVTWEPRKLPADYDQQPLYQRDEYVGDPADPRWSKAEK